MDDLTDLIPDPSVWSLNVAKPQNRPEKKSKHDQIQIDSLKRMSQNEKNETIKLAKLAYCLNIHQPDDPLSIAERMSQFSTEKDYFSTKSIHSPLGIILQQLFNLLGSQVNFRTKYSAIHDWDNNMFFDEYTWKKGSLSEQIIAKTSLSFDAPLEMNVVRKSFPL